MTWHVPREWFSSSEDVHALAAEQRLVLRTFVATQNDLGPYALVDADGREVVAVGEFLRAMMADGSPATTLRSYRYELLSWMRPVDCTKSYW